MRLLIILLFILVILLALVVACGGSKAGRPRWGGYFGGRAGGLAGEDQDDDYAEEGVHGGGVFRLKVRDPWYANMLNGEKRVEGRLNRGPFERLKKGDPVLVVRSRPKGDTSEFAGGSYKYQTEVVRVTPYDDYAALVKGEGPEKLYPGLKTAKEALEELAKFVRDDSDLKARAVAIELKAPPKA